MADSAITVITDRGQVSIPARLRREFTLSKGKRLLWERTGESELRVTVLEAEVPVGANAMRGFARTFRPNAKTTQEWTTELREGES